MLHRSLALPLHRASQRGGTVFLRGPRSSGKTALLEREFPGHTYVSLDNAADRARARANPAGFLARLRGPAIIDDLHGAPELVRHLLFPVERPLILVSSRRLTLGYETLELYAPTRAERQRREPVSLAMLGRFAPSAIPVATAFAAWPARRNFIESDLRDLVSVHDLDRFEAFLKTAQSHSGQILDQQSLVRQCGLSHSTVSRWLGVLDACFQTILLPFPSNDFGRRLIRRPKLHFLESECFESQVVSELFRNAKHAGETPYLGYWRDSNGLEIPLLVDGVIPVGIASSPNPADVNRLKRWMKLAGAKQGALIAESNAPARTGGILRYALDQL